jgi:phospholipase C
MIEWRWNLPSLTPRDAAANNIAGALDFGKAKRNAPTYSVPAGPFGASCSTTAAPIASVAGEWEQLQAAARSAGWPLP